MARRCVSEWPQAAAQLAASFWPGPLTIVLPRAKEISDIVTAGGSTVGVRWPSHPFIQAVIRECGFPLAAPSANQSNELSPTNAEHVQKSLGRRVKLIVDGGQCQVGIESTVVDASVTPPRVLRPGMIHEESLRAAVGDLQTPSDVHGNTSEALRSPGQLRKHYSPKARLITLSWRDDADLRAQLRHLNPAPDILHSTCVIAHSTIPSGEGFGGVHVIPHDAEAFARAIYAELHRCDEAGARTIIVEELPDGPEWRAIADRLHRASAP